MVLFRVALGLERKTQISLFAYPNLNGETKSVFHSNKRVIRKPQIWESALIFETMTIQGPTIKNRNLVKWVLGDYRLTLTVWGLQIKDRINHSYAI